MDMKSKNIIKSLFVLCVLITCGFLMKILNNDTLILWSQKGETIVPGPETTHEGDKFLIPADDVLNSLDMEQLTWIHWRYVNTIQIVCWNQMRHGIKSGKQVCMDKAFVPKKPCLVYSIGSQLNFEFELVILRVYNCEVHTFDPSIPITDKNKGAIPKLVKYHEIGLDGHDHVNERGWTMKTLPSIVNDLGHENRVIDILKIDAEGAEWSGFQTMDNLKPLENVKQLLIEFHFGIDKAGNNWGNTSSINQLRVIRALYDKGFRIFKYAQEGFPRMNKFMKYGRSVYQLNELAFINTKWY